LAQAAEANGEGLKIETADLVLARREIDKIIEWMDTWPTSDPTQRNAARAAIAAGEPTVDFSRMD
jgi:hypothetical protein